MEKNRSDKPDSHTSFIQISIIVVLLIIITWLVVTEALCGGGVYSMEESGQIGDSYGAVNALFSGLAFAAVIITLIMQVRNQQKSSEIDRYFKMIDFYQIGISNITTTSLERKKDINEPPEKVQGRKAFAEMKLQLKKLLDLIKKIDDKEKFGYSKEDIAALAYLAFYYGVNDAWKNLLKQEMKDFAHHDELVEKMLDYIKTPSYNRYALGRTNQTDLSAYFRNIYNAIKFIDESNMLSDQEKYDYVKILRAQFSTPELYILFFNLLSPFGKKWKESGYIEKS